MTYGQNYFGEEKQAYNKKQDAKKYVSSEKPENVIPIENTDFSKWKELRKHIVNDESKPCEFR